MRNYLHYLLILLFGVTQWGMAQTPQQAAKIVATYDQNELNKLKNEADLKYQYERNRVLDLAPKMGLPLIIDDGVTRSELQRILPDGTPIYYTTQNKDASHSTRTDHLNSGGSLGLNLMGQNMTAYVWDGGIARATHQEYSGRYTVGDGSSALSDHGAHVTGTIIASGVVAQAKGMAPQGKVRGYDWNNDITEATIAAANGMLVSNHSYGWVSNNLPAWYFGNYHSESASWDNIMFNAPYYLMVKSAGNDGAVNYNSSPLGGIVGYDKLTGAGTSKNSLVIANAQDANVNSNGDLISVSINSGSSQGPTDDYRIKPDITGNGTGLYSPISTNNSAYATYTGTSMSSPNVTGTLLLLQQHYNNINSEFMRAATLKGLVLHTADDAGPVGPDVVWGWGLLNAKRAAQVISNNGNGTLIQELTLNNGETYEFDVYSDEVSNLMASISWTDRPGANREGELNNTTPVLVNDLDLRIIKGGTSYEPWKLTGVTTNAKGDNFRDPFERVEVSNPTGQYKIRITHKGSLTGGSQKYSLIITGISDQPIECNPVVPAGLTATSVGTTTADLIWNMVPAAEYDFRYRATGSGSWITSSTATNTISLTGLTQDTEYEAQVRSKCSGGSNSAWSSSYIFTTLLPSTECGIDYAVNLGGTALGDTSAGIILTSDFPVGADVNLSVETVKFPMSNQVSTVKVSFYKDASGTPGDEVLSPTSVVPVSQTVISGEVYEITLDLSSLNLELEGGSTGTNYWMAITTTGTNANYWRSTDQIYNGTNGYGSLDNYASFEDLTNYGYVLDFAFTIEGDCGGNEQYTVVTSANPTAGGTTTGDGTYDGGDSVTVSATENTGYEFQNWTEGGTVVSTDSDYNFTIQSDRNLVANFSQTEYVITTNSNPITGGNTVGGGTYHYGDTATVTATATIGYTFVSWTEGGTVVSTNNTYSFTVDSSRTLTANFEMMDFMIITSSNPFAGGVTTGGGAYNYGDTATVSAFANTGYSFTSWTEGGIVVSTDPNYSFTVTSSRTLVANFDQLGYLITTMSSPAAGGTTSGGGSYNYGDTATVSATANAGYTFVNWTEGGTVVSTDEDYSFTVTSSRTLVANFSTNQYVITTSSNPTTGGSTSGGGTYNYGDTATVSAAANAGYTFVNWTEGGTVVSTNEDYSFTVTSSRTLVANFSLNAYTITTSSNPTAGGSTSGGGTYNYGDTATVSATANAGYTFVNWTEGGTVVSNDEDYSFTVTSSRTLVANFDQLGYLITTMSSPAAGGTTSGGGSYNYGDTATVSATANAGYTFVNWTEGGTVVSTNEDYSFTVTASRTLVANFSLNAYTITTSSNPTIGGSTSGGGTYNYGDTATVSATANAGYTFVNWTEGGTVVSNDEDYSFTVTSSRTLVANFSTNQYVITTSSNPTAGGNTTGGGTYNYGDTATVSATANTGYTFVNWTEGGTVVSTNEDYSFTVTSSRTLVANFSLNAYTITTSSNPTTGGSTSGGGTYNYGDTATVSAIANAGYAFVNWTEGGTVVSNDEDYSFTVTSSRTLVANFSTNQYVITTSSNPTTGGNTSGGGTYNYGDTATVSATANAGYTFVNWTEGGTVVSTNANYSFTVTASRTLVANFSLNAYTITTSSNPTAGGSTSGGGTYNYGDTATVSATANAGYTFVNWTEGGTVVSNDEDYSFTVTSSRTLVANFSTNQYVITTSSNPTAGGSTSGGGTYNYGDTATVSAAANAGYTFVNWTEGGTVVSTNANYSFTVTASRTLVANFSLNAYTITTSSNPTTGGSTSGGGTYNYGDTATVSAAANAGYTFVNWTEGGTVVSTDEDYSFTVTSSRTLVANFSLNAYTITTSSNPTTGGNTSGGGTYNYGDTATVSATANAGYTFVNWTEGGTVVSNDEDYSFTVTSSRTLVANFSLNAYTITTSSNPTAGGNTTGGGTYNFGDTATVSATANAGYTFVNWTEGGTVVSTNEDYSFTVTSSRTLVANFSTNAYTITTSSNPTAGGNTTGGGTYNYGDTATVSATANTGYTFVNWTEGGTVVSTNANYSFTVTASRTLVANFSQNAYTITTSSNPSAGGNTSGGGTYNYGDTATVSATANAGYTFLNWTESGTVVSTNEDYSFTVTASRTLVANFSLNAYTITTSSNPTAGGNTSGGGTYNYGDTATVSATANAGYTFVNWTEGGTVVSTDEDYSFTVTSSRTLVANFSTNQYIITTSSNPTVGGTTSGGGTYNYGDTATVSATANVGYTFINWTEGGTVVSNDEDYSFTVTSSRDLVANFSQDEYIITTVANPTVGGTTAGGGTYHYGDTATVVAVANPNYNFVNWTENGTVVSTDATYSFTVTESRNLTANFDEIMSVDDPISKTYGIYPNPVRDFATVMMGDEHINSVQIYHVSGQLVKVLKGNGLNQFQIDMRLYDKTSYIIKVFTDKGVKTFKILRK